MTQIGNITELSNDDLDMFIEMYKSHETIVHPYLAERSRRIKNAQQEDQRAEEFYLKYGAWPDEMEEHGGDIIVRIRNLTPLQVDRLCDAHENFCSDGFKAEEILADHWIEKKTYIETTYRVVEALYDSISNMIPEDVASLGYDTTPAQSDMVFRAARMSIESLSAKLSKSLGYPYSKQHQRHLQALKEVKRCNHYDLEQYL